MKKYKKIIINPSKNFWRNSRSLQTIGLAFLSLFFLVGTSYAMINKQLERKNFSIQTGNLEIDFINGNQISIDHVNSSNHEELIKYFHIDNMSNMDSKYQIFLEVVNGEEYIDPKYIQYSIRKENEPWSLPKRLSKMDRFNIEKNQFISKNSRINYQLRIWVQDGFYDVVKDHKFQAKIIVAD